MKLVLSCIFILVSSFICHSQTWELEKNKDGIKVYTRSTTNSNFKEYKAECYVEASPKKVTEVILRVGDYQNWFPDCKESKELKRDDKKSELVCYQLIDCPWPTLNRDAVVLMKVKRLEKTYRIDFENVTGYKDKVENVVRAEAKGYWKISPSKKGCKVIYQNAADPKGRVPAWVANLFIVDAPYKTLKALKAKFSTQG